MAAGIHGLGGNIVETAGNTWLVGLFCTALGAVAGYAAAWVFGTGNSRTRDMEARLQQARDELKDYRLDVNTHFSRTAELLTQLGQSYREVHNHLARGAQALCERPGQLPLLQPLAEQPAYAAPEEQLGLLQDVRPPLDYAPKATPSERGMLREDFGLDKPSSLQGDATVDAHFDDDDDPTLRDGDDYTGLSHSRN